MARHDAVDRRRGLKSALLAFEDGRGWAATFGLRPVFGARRVLGGETVVKDRVGRREIPLGRLPKLRPAEIRAAHGPAPSTPPDSNDVNDSDQNVSFAQAVWHWCSAAKAAAGMPFTPPPPATSSAWTVPVLNGAHFGAPGPFGSPVRAKLVQ